MYPEDGLVWAAGLGRSLSSASNHQHGVDDNGTQQLVALDDVVERSLERRDVDMAGDAQPGDGVEPVAEGAPAVSLVQRAEVLLGVRQRVPALCGIRLAGG